MEVVQKMLQQREVDHHALNSKRMEHYWCVPSINLHNFVCNNTLCKNGDYDVALNPGILM